MSKKIGVKIEKIVKPIRGILAKVVFSLTSIKSGNNNNNYNNEVVLAASIAFLAPIIMTMTITVIMTIIITISAAYRIRY